MRSSLRAAAVYVAAGLGAGVVVWLLSSVVGQPMTLLPVLLGTLCLAVGLWLILLRLDPPEPTGWPHPRTVANLSGDVRERGAARHMSTLQSALRGSKLSEGEVEELLAERVAARLIRRGADPDDPFGHLEEAVSPSLARLCRRAESGAAPARVTRKSMSHHLKEIVKL